MQDVNYSHLSMGNSWLNSLEGGRHNLGSKLNSFRGRSRGPSFWVSEICLRLKVFISVLVCTHSSVFGGVVVHLLARSVLCFFFWILEYCVWYCGHLCLLALACSMKMCLLGLLTQSDYASCEYVPLVLWLLRLCEFFYIVRVFALSLPMLQ